MSQQKATALKNLAVAKARYSVLAQSRKQELAHYDRIWKRELSSMNPRSVYARKRIELIALLDKAAKKEEKRLSDAMQKAEKILGPQESPKRSEKEKMRMCTRMSLHSNFLLARVSKVSLRGKYQGRPLRGEMVPGHSCRPQFSWKKHVGEV